MRRFEFSTGGSDKFWEVEVNGNELTVRFGRIGTNGQSQTKSFASEAAALKEHDKLIAEKTKKGYVEVEISSSTQQSSLTTLSAPIAQPSKGGRSVEALKSVLQQAGVDMQTFERAETGLEEEEEEGEGRHRRSDDSLYTMAVPKQTAIEVWNAVRAATTETGYWPIFTEDPDTLFEYLEFNEDEPTVILKNAGHVDTKQWLQKRRADDAELYGAGDGDRDDGASGENANGWQPHSEEQNIAHADDFYTVQTVGDSTVPMVFLPTKIPWHVPAVLRWGGSNDGIEPFEHTALHKYWHEKYGTEPVVATASVLEFKVTKPPETQEEAMALATEQFVYCPDIVHQGTVTVAGLASELIYSRRWFFWWD